MIVVIGTSKGGEGKSTIATNLAAMLATRGKEVLLVDADPQASSYTWTQARDLEHPNLPRVSSVCLQGKIRDKLLQQREKYDYLIVDTQGRESAELTSACLVADILIMPFSVGFFNVWALESMANMVDRARLVNENLQVYALVNKASTNSKVTDHKETETILEQTPEVQPLQAKLLNTVLYERRIYRYASGMGLAVEEMPETKEYKEAKIKAAAELQNLYGEIFENEL